MAVKTLGQSGATKSKVLPDSLSPTQLTPVENKVRNPYSMSERGARRKAARSNAKLSGIAIR